MDISSLLFVGSDTSQTTRLPKTHLKLVEPQTDDRGMGRSVIGFCAMLGMTVGGFVPALWGDSGFSLMAVLFTAVGGVAGVWAGVRIADV